MISVALCTHNGGRYLGEQIRSICAQTLLPDEIVLSDDDSTDDSIEVVRDALARGLAERPIQESIDLKVLRNRPALRVTRNFEQAVRACSGGLIALCDQDDAWAPDRLELMAAEFARRPELTLLHSDAWLVDSQGERLSSMFSALAVRPSELSDIHGGRAFEVLIRRNLVTGATTMFRRSLLASALPFPSECVHDEWLGAIAAAVGQVDVLERQLIDYRQHGSNQIGVKRDTFLDKVRRALPARANLQRLSATKAQRLLERLVELGSAVEPQKRDLVAQKLEHHLRRARLPEARLRRVLPVLAEASTGRYWRFDRGSLSVLRDLVEYV